MTDEQKPLSRFFHTPLTPGRMDDQWEAIAARLPSARRADAGRRTATWGVLIAATAALLLVAGRSFWSASHGAIDGAVLETSATEHQTLVLHDGSHLTLEPLTRMRLVKVSGAGIRLEVERGAVDAQVTKVAGRPFTVVAGAVEVTVVGTKFRVALDADDAEAHVRVEEGRVQITRTDGAPAPSFLSAGETWSTLTPVRSEASAISSLPSARPVSPAASAGERKPRAPRTVLSPRFHELLRAGRYAEAYGEVSPRFAELVPAANAGDLFAMAEAARLSGHPSDAARAFDALRVRHREDARAGLAALELGRLRLNELRDPRGAAEAFSDSVQLQPEGFFREDAEARRVQALDEAGEDAECKEAREKYLAAYPSGLHVAAVTRRCHAQ